MPFELRVPEVGESISEVMIGKWLKSQGDQVNRDDAVVEIESDKATLELPAPTTGTITEILVKEGEKAKVGDVIGYMEESLNPGLTTSAADHVATTPEDSKKTTKPNGSSGKSQAKEPAVMPSAKRVLAEAGVSAGEAAGTGPGGRVLKEDAMKAVAQKPATAKAAASIETDGFRQEEVVPMSPMRHRIAERLVQAQQDAALLTTFNEVDMSQIMALRSQFQDSFQKKYGIKLGFMSFFVKAAIDALKQFPQINAEIREDSIAYRNYYDIGIAIGGGKGLVVPIVRNAELLSFAEIEQAIADFGARAKENKIDLEELKGGTFTISNGGVYGSLLSTPIVNPPQSGILGLHAIQDRPVAIDGQVVIRPMMYIALTYDHRIVDGREAVTFLRRIKECIEDPTRMLVEV